MTRALVAAVIVTLAAAVPLRAAPPGDATITLRTYNYARASADRLADARATAATILNRAGIGIEWIDCRVPQGDGAPCDTPLVHGRELMLRLMDTPRENHADARGAVSLGSAMLDKARAGGVLITMDLLPVRAVAESARCDFSTLLGRAIAHEIGHLLLGSAHHPPDGLMRAFWSQDELRGAKSARWFFSPGEAAQMRRSLAPRPRGAN